MTKPTTAPKGHQQCLQCRKLKRLDAFNIDRSRPNGLRPYCRDCDNEARARRRALERWTPARLTAKRASLDRIAAIINVAQAGTSAAASG
jgi:hypothetical protein